MRLSLALSTCHPHFHLFFHCHSGGMYPTQIWNILFSVCLFRTNRFKIWHRDVWACACLCEKGKETHRHTYICWFVTLIRTHIIFTQTLCLSHTNTIWCLVAGFCHSMQLHVPFTFNGFFFSRFFSLSFLLVFTYSTDCYCRHCCCALLLLMSSDAFDTVNMMVVLCQPHTRPQWADNCRKRTLFAPNQFLIKNMLNTNELIRRHRNVCLCNIFHSHSWSLIHNFFFLLLL